MKENSTATQVEDIPFDKCSDINTGIESYGLYANKGVKFSVVRYRDPETGNLHNFISTIPGTISPGIIAMLYYKRWAIEKACNNSIANLKEKKAWSANQNALKTKCASLQ